MTEPKVPSGLTFVELLGLILVVALLSIMLWPVFYHTPWPTDRLPMVPGQIEALLRLHGWE
jgi:Tfp pilus assembly protein FimT